MGYRKAIKNYDENFFTEKITLKDTLLNNICSLILFFKYPIINQKFVKP